MTDFSILWSDQALLVIDKPAGLLVVPDGYDPSLPHVKSELADKYGRLWIVHRLDRDTSGVMLLARSAEAHKILNTQFQKRAIEKVYTALVVGRPEWDRQLVQLPLRTNTGRRHRTVVDFENGKSSETQIQVIERLKDCSLIRAKPSTGRRHQIRAHLSHVGFPIICDRLYGDKNKLDLLCGDSPANKPLLERTALHASSINFRHPVSGRNCLFEAALAADMQLALNALRSWPAK